MYYVYHHRTKYCTGEGMRLLPLPLLYLAACGSVDDWSHRGQALTPPGLFIY
ncbi:hypothetical protein [Telluribacter sp. SYSU D00476]|uniref:hypothetical protein n=1 Tax=Telluribacter sp. SYSU D00476 TaxID=2811430 RepID=UPI001FF434EB|nr:hypothetical protein [Telluribacter sp. SYSU D00476]